MTGSEGEPDDLTGAERKAVAALRRLARTWPRTLMLASMDGSLVVLRSADRGSADGGINEDSVVADIRGIPNTGGSW